MAFCQGFCRSVTALWRNYISMKKKEMESLLREQIIGSETVFEGKVIHVDHAQVRLPGGESALREIVRHIGAAAVVPVDQEGRVTLVWQYRPAVDRLTLEIPAGKLDRGDEPPLSCAQRELTEETGLTAESWHLLTTLDTTPGFCDERISVYLATGLTQGEAHPDPDEYLSLEQLPLSEALQLVLEGTLRDGKTVAGLMLAAQLLGIAPSGEHLPLST